MIYDTPYLTIYNWGWQIGGGGVWGTFVQIQGILQQDNILKLVKLNDRYHPPDTGFQIQEI